MSNGSRIILTRFWAVYFVSVYAILVYNAIPGLAGLLRIRLGSALFNILFAGWFFMAFSVCFFVVERFYDRMIIRLARGNEADHEEHDEAQDE